MCVNKLILSFEKGYKTLSVTCGDSSPKGRAKTLSVTCGDSSPKGRAKGLAPLYIVCWHETVSIRSIDCFMNTHLRLLRFFVPRKNPCGEAALHGAKLCFIFHAP